MSHMEGILDGLYHLWREQVNSYELAALHKMLDKEEVALLKACALQLPPNPVIVNIGSCVGTSSIAMLEERPDAFIFSVDLKREREEEYVKECGLDTARIHRVLKDSKEFGKYFPYQVDMVFIDGDHTDAGVSGDIEAWVPKARYIVAYHDYHHPRYKEKPNVHLDEIVDAAMAGWDKIGEARYLVAFSRNLNIPELQASGYYVVD